uniref:RAB29, member RAS onco family n=1 Tax=Callorhinchus milii TaxID=7868 RepID=A0A4W3GK35_CALMI
MLCAPITPTLAHPTIGGWAFHHSAPTLWNSIPQFLRLAPSFATFKTHLKTLLFDRTFDLPAGVKKYQFFNCFLSGTALTPNLQERFTSMTRLYYRQAGACIIMFDVTNVTTFWNCLKWKHDLDGKVTLMDGSPVPCVLLANKVACASSKDLLLNLLFSKQNHFVGWIETSVKENKNINRAMRYVGWRVGRDLGNIFSL